MVDMLPCHINKNQLQCKSVFCSSFALRHLYPTLQVRSIFSLNGSQNNACGICRGFSVQYHVIYCLAIMLCLPGFDYVVPLQHATWAGLEE